MTPPTLDLPRSASSVTAAAVVRPQVTLLTARGNDGSWLRERARGLPRREGDRYVSRSYCHPYAVVAGHALPIGIDLERIEPDDPALLESIVTPSERALGTTTDGELSVSSLWCSKEALAKALGDARDYDPRRLESPALWPAGRSGRWRARSLDLVEGYATWIVWQEAGAGDGA